MRNVGRLIFRLLQADRIFFDSAFRDQEWQKGESMCAGRDFYCWINASNNQGESEEVLTLLHELLHWSRKFRYRELSREDPNLELEIEHETKRILKERPDIKALLLKKLREAKAFQIRESCEDIWENLNQEIGMYLKISKRKIRR